MSIIGEGVMAMRLIDADALEQTFRRWLAAKDYNEAERHIMRAAIIECQDAPTVQPDAPRVMTLEEALGADECWIEGRSGACGYGDALISNDGERVDFYRPHSIDTLDFYAYGKVWRCWTARPTDEQRKKVKWDADGA